jgi:hypothetical protein
MYTGETLEVLEETMVDIKYEEQLPVKLSLIIARGNGPDPISQNWLQSVKLNLQQIHTVNCLSGTSLDNLLKNILF